MFIYVIVCSKTLKIYIGQHKGKDLQHYLQQKLYEARNHLKVRSHLYAAMRKYPRKSWSIHPLVSDVQTRTELDELEKHYIRVLKTQHPDVGYNICDGGEGFTGPHTKAECQRISKRMKAQWAGGWQGMRGKKHTKEWKQHASARMNDRTISEETKHRISETLMGHKVAEETRQKQSAAKKVLVGEKNPFFGKHHLEESKRKNAEAHRGRKMSEETKRKMSEAQKARQAKIRLLNP